MRLTFVAAATLAILAAAIASQQVLYEGLVVPRLSGLPAVPLLWWFGVEAPVIVVTLTCGWMARSWRDALAAAALAALGLQAYLYWAATTGRPGLQKSFAIEAPLYYWTGGVMTVFLLLLVPILLARIGHAGLRRSTAAS